MDSRRKSLINAVGEAVSEIKPGLAGYRSNVPASHVYQSATIPSEFPAIVIIIGAERRESSSMDLLTFRLPITIECWVDSADGNPVDALEDLLADVRQAVQTDDEFWGYIVELDDLGASSPVLSEMDPNRGQCSLNLEVVYRHQRTNPSQP